MGSGRGRGQGEGERGGRRGKGRGKGEGEGEDVGEKAVNRDCHCIPETETVSPVGETTAKKQDAQ